ncbi:MAG TPA: GH92 family glycosyl hydrolase [Chryseosolibacter sp.]|nr:GH92 family glycosyl hydrolase [Chryseosolibacter sp.]
MPVTGCGPKLAAFFRLLTGALLSCLVSVSGLCQQPVDLVYPHLDAANSRWFYFSSASVPFGMINLFPDNNISGEWHSGYRYNEDTIRCISHIHEWQLAGVAVMPVAFHDGDVLSVLRNMSSAFSHDREQVSPGYHQVVLDRFGINAELSASTRAGFHRYTYTQSGQGVIFDFGGQLGPSMIASGGFSKTNANELRGYVTNAPTFRRPKDTPVYFTAIFNRPIKNIYLLANGVVTNVEQWSGEQGRILVTFDDAEPMLMMKVGVSFTDEEGASRNVNAEIPHWNFDEVRHQARKRWNEMLSRIGIAGGTREQQRRFYTDLWHAIQGRRIISDFDGRYSDHTGTTRVVRQTPIDDDGRPKFNMYNSDAFWGAQWTLNTLWQLVYPEVAEEFCNSFIEYYKNGGLIPRGPSGGADTFVMTGASSTPFFVSAWQKGIRGFDVATAYEGLKKNHLPGGAMAKAGYEHHSAKGGGLEHYIGKGWVPYPVRQKEYGFHQDGAGMTLEYAYQDWTLAQLSKALNHDADHEYFLKRSQHYRSLYNPQTGFMQPKDSAGQWKKPFDPLLYDNGFVEGNAAQFTWFVPHDLDGLFTLMGGRDSAINRLNEQFERSSTHGFCSEHPGLANKVVDEKRTWLNYSNQPSMHASFIFNHAGAPWLTQYWTREVVDHVYSALSPSEGYSGDEDQGLMGALGVILKMGIFQMTGGCEPDPRYDICSPIFDSITIKLDPRYYPGKSFRIETRNNSHANRYIRSARLNGKSLSRAFLRHSEIVTGGTLVIQMSDSPNKRWGLARE